MRGDGRGRVGLLGGLCLLMSAAAVPLTGLGVAHASTVTAGQAPTTLTTSLSDGTNSGTSITVPAGTAVTDTATLTGTNASTATGTVTYNVFSDAACTVSVNSGTPEPITAAGTLPASASVTLPGGTYYWQATYSGDANNDPSTSDCGPAGEVETVTPTSTTVTTTLAGGNQSDPAITVPAGTPVTDSATLAGVNAGTATGTVIYTVYSDQDCTTVVSTGTVPITTPGTVPASAPVTLPGGTYYWQATYSGDASNTTSMSACGPGDEVETVTPTSTTVSTSLAGGGKAGAAIGVPVGTPVTDGATLSGPNAGAATGTVTYTVYSNAACTTPVSTGKPEAITTPGTPPSSAPVTLTTAGIYYWQAVYSGDADNVRSVSPCGPAGEVETVTPVQRATAVSTSLAGGGKAGAAISVPAGTAVTDTAKLTGTNASQATGTVTYTVYSNAACTTPVSTGKPEAITTPGTLPASAPVTLSSTGTYYWQASYPGDENNAPSKSPCGPGDEAETVTPAPTQTTLTTSLLSGAKSGTSITVQAGTPVRDSAHLAGTNAAKATGTVTYKVYSNAACTALVASAGSVTVTGGAVPGSAAQSLAKPGTYYWTAAYSGNSGNKPSASGCGAATEIVTPAPVVDTVSSARASHSAAVNVSTTGAGDLLVAFVSGRGPAGKGQTATVSSGGLKWTLAGRENTGRGDAEIWDARAAGELRKLRVTTTQRYTGSNVTLTVVAFKDAVGTGRHATFHSGSGAPMGTLTTSKSDSLVFAVGDDWLKPASRTPGSGQAVDYQSTDSGDTYWVQAARNAAPGAGTRVTINDTRPARDPYNLVLVEVLWG